MVHHDDENLTRISLECMITTKTPIKKSALMMGLEAMRLEEELSMTSKVCQIRKIF